MIELSIKRTLTKDNELHTVLDEIYKRGGVACGGFPRYCAIEESGSIDMFNDIDIYPKDKESFESIVGFLQTNEYFRGYIKDSPYPNIPRMLQGMYVKRFNSHNFSVKFQILEKFGTPEEIINTFDFSICQAYLDMSKVCVMVTPEFIRDEEKKELVILNLKEDKDENGSSYIWRLSSYKTKGYKITLSTILKVLEGIGREHWPYFISSVIELGGEELLKNSSYEEREMLSFVGGLQSL